MGKPYKRLKYDPPETYRLDDMIGYGEAVSMISDLLTPDGERRDCLTSAPMEQTSRIA